MIYSNDFLHLTPKLDFAAFWAENNACLENEAGKLRCTLEFFLEDYWLFALSQPIQILRCNCAGKGVVGGYVIGIENKH